MPTFGAGEAATIVSFHAASRSHGHSSYDSDDSDAGYRERRREIERISRLDEGKTFYVIYDLGGYTYGWIEHGTDFGLMYKKFVQRNLHSNFVNSLVLYESRSNPRNHPNYWVYQNEVKKWSLRFNWEGFLVNQYNTGFPVDIQTKINVLVRAETDEDLKKEGELVFKRKKRFFSEDVYYVNRPRTRRNIMVKFLLNNYL